MGPTPPPQEILLTDQSAADHGFQVALATDAGGAPSGAARLWVSAPHGAPNIASVALWCGDDAGGAATPVRALAPRIRIAVEAASCRDHGGRDLKLRVEYRNGERARLSWPPAGPAHAASPAD